MSFTPIFLARSKAAKVFSGAYDDAPLCAILVTIADSTYLDSLTISRNWLNMYPLSLGPGEASEWYWILIAGRDLCLIPSTVWSFMLKWLTSTSEGRESASIE